MITATFGPAIVSKLLVDNRSSVNILFKNMFDKMRLLEENLKSCINPIHGFTGETIVPLGIIQVPLTVGTAPKTVMRNVDFIVLHKHSPYNIFIGRLVLSTLRATTANWCLSMKVPTPFGTGEVRGDQSDSRMLYASTLDVSKRALKKKGADVDYCAKAMNA